ncbi:uncharacterized protein LOC125670465 [Ostrea edulis]|uniref:uncharacterized protein LOC125670465 n=1 Tax=Ostrea edulis TaxID=37623 RepID=UPI0024AEA231|nr:uncharacterized protein LOC125670465 [Ostrea edulis]
MAQLISHVFCLLLVLEVCKPALTDKKAIEDGSAVLSEVKKTVPKHLKTESKAKELLQKMQTNPSRDDPVSLNKDSKLNAATPEQASQQFTRQLPKFITRVVLSQNSSRTNNLNKYRTASPEKSLPIVEGILKVQAGALIPGVKTTESERKGNYTVVKDIERDRNSSDAIQAAASELSKLSTVSTKENKKTTPVVKKVADVVKNVGRTPGPLLLDPEDKTAEDDLFGDENMQSKDGDDQHHDDYEREEDDWYQGTDILDSKDNSDEDKDDWDFWNDHHEIVTKKDVNVADKFGDFWDEESYAHGVYLKEKIVTSPVVRNHRRKLRTDVSMMTLYSWMLFISMAMLVLYVFYKQKNVFKPYWSYLNHRTDERRLSSEEPSEERRAFINHAYS